MPNYADVLEELVSKIIQKSVSRFIINRKMFGMEHLGALDVCLTTQLMTYLSSSVMTQGSMKTEWIMVVLNVNS